MDFKGILGRRVYDLADFAASYIQGGYDANYLTRNGGLFVSQEPYYSTGFFTAASNAIAAGSEVNVFQTPLGSSGQGLPATVTTGLTAADTNVEVVDMFPDGQCFVAVGAIIDIYACNLGAAVVAGQLIRSWANVDSSTAGVEFAADASATEYDIKCLQSNLLWRWEKIGMQQDRVGFCKDFPCAGGPTGYGGAVGRGVTVALTASTGTLANGTIGGVARGVARNGGPFTIPTSFQVPIVIAPKSAIKSTLKVERAIAGLSQAEATYGVKISLLGLRFNLGND